MEYSFIYDPEKIVSELIHRIMTEEAIDYEIIENGTLSLPNEIEQEKLTRVQNKLSQFKINIKATSNLDLVDKIKICVRKFVQQGNARNVKMSELLVSELGFSYPYLSNHFSSNTYTSIENFYILVRIEKVKEMVLMENAKLSEIAYELNFSSVPHLSNQFKKITGLTITQYLKFRKIKEENSSINT